MVIFWCFCFLCPAHRYSPFHFRKRGVVCALTLVLLKSVQFTLHFFMKVHLIPVWIWDPGILLYGTPIHYCIPRSPRACNAVSLLNLKGCCLQRYITLKVQRKRPFRWEPELRTGMLQQVRQRNTDGVDICPTPAKTELCAFALIQILVDPARGHCYRGLTKPCESRGARPRRTAQ